MSSQSVPINQVEDAAIWIHPTDPEKSLLLIANKTHGMELHDFNGVLIKHYDDGKPLAGLDVLYDFPLGKEKIDLAIAACPSDRDSGVRVWRIDPAKDRITDVTAKGIIPVLDDAEPLGIAAYHSRKTGACYFFVTTEEGKIEQYELAADADGQISARRVRQLSLPGKVKAGVADDENAVIYFALEKEGVYRFAAEPDRATSGQLVIKVNDHGLIPDFAGITLYGASGGKGYLIVVSQGPKGVQSTLGIYQRQAPNEYVLTVSPSLGGMGGIYSSSGIAVTNRPTSVAFPQGVIAAKNRINSNGIEDYKLYSWKEIAAAGGLVVDTDWSPRSR
ncbi:MAG TPA: phytase [Phycisphaerae bacterium]